MITDKLLDIVFSFLNSILDALPVMDLEVDFSVLNAFLDIVGTCLYFFPWQKVLPILGIIMMLQVWRILISIIKVIWQLLPLV